MSLLAAGPAGLDGELHPQRPEPVHDQRRRPYGYDGNGNLTTAATWSFFYDPENHMTSVTIPGTNASYTYDPLDHRSSKLVNGVYTFFLGDLRDDEIAEYDRNNNGNPVLLRRFIPGPGIDQPIAMVTAAGVRTYFHADRIGSVVAMSSDTGARTEGPFSYDAFGQACTGAGTSSCTLASGGVPFKFAGRRLDPESNQMYFRARYYNYALGRFDQTDGIGYAADLNLYTYVGNDPINKTDPSGNCFVTLYLSPECQQFLQGFYDGSTSTIAGLKWGAANSGVLGEKAQARAQSVAVALDAAATIVANNPREAAEMYGDYLLERGIPYQLGFTAGNTLPLAALTRGRATRLQSIGLGSSNFVASRFGAAVNGINGLFDKLEDHGINPSALSNAALGNAFLAAAGGMKLDYDSQTGLVTASRDITGTRLQGRITICAFGRDHCK